MFHIISEIVQISWGAFFVLLVLHNFSQLKNRRRKQYVQA